MQDFTRVRQVTANYFYMQGLRLVPFGFVLILTAILVEEHWLGPLAGLAPLPHLAGLAIAFALFRVIGAYYERTFGKVETAPRGGRFWIVYGAAVGTLVVAMVLDDRFQPPVSLFGLTFGVLILAYWAATGSFRTHYLALAGCIFALGLLPLAGVPVSSALLLAAVGVVYMVGGLLDHRLLVRTLRPLPEEHHDAGL